jgi:hypothetical protein
MIDIDITATLGVLMGCIEIKKHELGIDESKLKVRMGRKLADVILNFDLYLVRPFITKETTIFGIPLEIDYNDDMCLEVHIIEKVPVIIKEGEIID